MLLKVASEEKRKTAANATYKDVFNLEFFLFRRRQLFIFRNKAECNKRNKNDSADKGTNAVESERADACALALGNE